MGWSSWNNYGHNINDSIIKAQADAMVSSGLADLGFKYINIDDGFFDGRNADGSLRINATKFPYGMKALADYIHSKGLKAGFYSEAGANTCGSIWGAQTGGVGGGLYNVRLEFEAYDSPDFYAISLELNSAWFNKLSAMLKSKACKISAETNCPNKKQNKLINIIIKLVL
jgi:hypothetical protein